MSELSCPFCRSSRPGEIAANSVGLAFPDSYPITEGHTLVIPRRHVASLYDLPPDDQAALWSLVAEVRTLLKNKYSVTDFNIGVNDGTAAGQTILHAHIHVIPRRPGDVADPRGGVRWVLPDKAAYWAGSSHPRLETDDDR